MSQMDYFFSLSAWELVMNIITTMLLYTFIPIILRLKRSEPYDKKKANKIAIINSVIIALILFILREISGEVKNNAISQGPAFLYWGINLSLLQWKIKEKNKKYILMILSLLTSFTSCFSAVLLLGPISVAFAMVGLKELAKGYKWQKIVFYVEEFLGLFLWFSFLHSLLFDFGIMYVWGFIYALIFMLICNARKLIEKITGMNLETKKEIKIENEKKSNEVEETTEIKKKVVYCKKCGGKLDDNKKCKKCGKQYFKYNRIITFYLVILCLAITVIILTVRYIDLKNTVGEIAETCSTGSEWCEAQLDVLTGEHSWLYVSDKLDFFDENIVFVLEGYGNYYYSYDCVEKITNGNDYTYWAYNKQQAIAKGYIEGSCY